jgi:hypothetical protein
MTVGSILVEYTIGADIAPEPFERLDQYCSYPKTRGKEETVRTWVKFSARRENPVRVGQDEMTSLVLGQIRMSFTIFLIVYRIVRFNRYSARGKPKADDPSKGVRTDVTIESAQHGSHFRVFCYTRIIPFPDESDIFRVLRAQGNIWISVK